jgi:hypothetical protein
MKTADRVFNYTLDAQLAEIQRDRGMQRAERGADDSYKALVLAAIADVARAHALLTTDEVLTRLAGLGLIVPEMRVLGPIMMLAQRSGYIQPTSTFVKSDSVKRHRAFKRQWRSQIYLSAAAVSAETSLSLQEEL